MTNRRRVDGNIIGGARLSLMSFGPGVFSNQLSQQLSTFDLVATKAVFNSGLRPGAARDDFLRVGLVNPPGSGGRAATRAIASTPGGQVPASRIR